MHYNTDMARVNNTLCLPNLDFLNLISFDYVWNVSEVRNLEITFFRTVNIAVRFAQQCKISEFRESTVGSLELTM